MSELSLYNLSVEKTVLMLKETVRTVTGDWKIQKNTFSYLPTSVVEDLFSYVLKISNTLEWKDLYHLVTSGRIQNFKLENVELTPEVLFSILEALSVACHSLKSFILRDISNPEAQDFADHGLCSTTVRSAVAKCIVNSASNLEHVESCISFDLKAVRRCTNLKILRLNFRFTAPLLDILDERDGVLCFNNSLKVLEFCKDERNILSSTDIAVLLSYCSELIELNYDVSEALEYLHGDQIDVGTLSRQYKLKKCSLGPYLNFPPSEGSLILENSSSASKLAVRIGILTCPLVEELYIVVGNDSTVSLLSDFLNLKSLHIYWKFFIKGEFMIVRSLLQKIGANLKVLHLVKILEADFVAIGKSCPSLENLKVVCLKECSSVNDSCCALFCNLQSLFISKPVIEEETLLLTLSNCENLTALSIMSAECLNDRVLSEVLSRNPMSKVTQATISRCSVSDEGVRNLINHLKMLKFLHFSSSAIESRLAAVIVRQLNPAIGCFSYF